MRTFATLVVLFFPLLAEASFQRTGRILGGDIIKIEQAPYQVELVMRKLLPCPNATQTCEKQYVIDGHYCGGSIISPNFILTAAHCHVYRFSKPINASDLLVVAGANNMMEKDAVTVEVEKIIPHELFELKDKYRISNYDFCLLKLRTPLNFTKKIKAIDLPLQDEPVEEGTFSVVSGWGQVHYFDSDVQKELRAVTLLTLNQSECQLKWMKEERIITDQMLCAGLEITKADACQGKNIFYSSTIHFFLSENDC